jgi:nicotinic acid mononucleotide adenylyltransferase
LNLSKPVRVIYVAGLDLFDRCNGMRSLRKPPLGGVAVIYRPGPYNQLAKSITLKNEPNVFYVSDDEEQINDISSTLIRRKLRDNEACEHLTYSSVLGYLKMIPLDNK